MTDIGLDDIAEWLASSKQGRANADEYRDAIRAAVEAGMKNTKIADIVGVTDTAIRMYRKRHKI
jgi:plasmid stabilization system protein ParE